MMRNTADAVIIGGGVMGCSLLYYLARRGAGRPLLLERNVLGAGSTGRKRKKRAVVTSPLRGALNTSNTGWL